MNAANPPRDATSRTSQTSQPPQTPPERRSAAPPREDAEKFGRLVGRGGRGRDGGAGAEEGISGGMESGDGLSDLFKRAAGNIQGAGQPPPGAAPGAAEIARPAAVDPARCDEIVERILVARPASDGSAEVRIKLDRAWLPDTEVRLARSSGGGLSVEFMTDRVEAQRFLLPNLAELRERLTERAGGQVSVGLSESAGAGADTGDGRSRNRRSLFEERGEE